MNGYAIAFDMEIDSLRKYYGEPYNSAYEEIKKVLAKHTFYWVQGSVYLTQGNLVTITSAITELKTIDWFRNSVRDIRVFKVEEWSNFTDFVKN